MTLALLMFAAMFTVPVLLSVIALTGETTLRGLWLAMRHASSTGYSAETSVPSTPHP